MDAALLLKGIDLLLAVTGLLQKAGINYQEVIDAQNAAGEEGLTFEQRKAFVDQAQSAIDQL